MNLVELLSPKENRFRYVENKEPLIKIGSSFVGTLVCFARGAAIGGITSMLLSGGNPKYTTMGACLGSAIDGFQDAIRKIKLFYLYHNNPQEYKEHMKENYNREVIID